jgi:hypothetical protein
MNKDQEDTLNMYEATNDVLQSNAAIWTPNVPFNAAVGELEDGIADIGDLRDQQEADTTGITEDKDERRTTLEEKTYTIGSVISFYASTTGNRDLLKKVNFGKSELSKARDNELPGMSDQVHQAAVDNAAAILPYGVTALMTAALKTAIDNYVDYISKPRAAVSETSAATEQLPNVFENTDKLLEERIDKGMELFKAANPDFYAQYFIAREIINSPTQKRSLMVHVENGVTHIPIEHVKIIVDSAINRRSSQNGNSWVQNLGEGGHTLTASLPGYADVIQNFNVISGETTKITLNMQPE